MKKIADQYAQSLFNAFDTLDEQTAALNVVRVIEKVMTTSKETQTFFNSYSVTNDEKFQIIEEAFGEKFDKKCLTWLQLIVKNKRVEVLPAVTGQYQALTDEANGVVRGQVRSASPLTDSEKESLLTKIQKVTNKKVILEYVEDQTVIGGIKATVGSYTFDDTIKTHLTNLKESLMRSVH